MQAAAVELEAAVERRRRRCWRRRWGRRWSDSTACLEYQGVLLINLRTFMVGPDQISLSALTQLLRAFESEGFGKTHRQPINYRSEWSVGQYSDWF